MGIPFANDHLQKGRSELDSLIVIIGNKNKYSKTWRQRLCYEISMEIYFSPVLYMYYIYILNIYIYIIYNI